VIPVKAQGLPDVLNRGTAAEYLAAAIRVIIREELERVYPGTHSTIEGEQEARGQATVKAWVDDDGEYELADTKEDGSTRRAPKGKKTVELTTDEAREAGLNV
jgi:hypothetical protein